MDEHIKERLESYYCDSLLNKYVYSKDLKRHIEKRNIVFEDWFLDCMEFNVDYNNKHNIYGENEKSNCQTMICAVLMDAIDKEDLETVEKCNELIRTLNCSRSDNYYDYMVSEFILSSPNEKRAGRVVAADLVNFDRFGEYYDSSADVAAYLLGDYESSVPKILTLSSYVIHSLVIIIKRIPEILEDPDLVQKMANILAVNKMQFDNDYVLKADCYLTHRENKEAIKYLKKTYKKSLK